MSIWKNEFGDDYQKRNLATPNEISNRKLLWSKVIEKCPDINTVLEIGAGQGANLYALLDCMAEQPIDGDIAFTEVNELQKKILVTKGFIEDRFDNDSYTYNLVFTYGVLIHVNPYNIEVVMDDMYTKSDKYIVMCEYFRPTCEMIPYRGKSNEMWGNDFGKIFMTRYSSKVILVDCGFMWKESTGLDNITYWVFKKNEV